MNKNRALFLCMAFMAFFLANEVSAQSTGPVISEYGKVWRIDDAEIPGDPAMQLHAVFDVYDNTVSEAGINRQLETAARYLNLHAQNGIPVENLHVALVVHGGATDDLLNPDPYMVRHGFPNASADLVVALLEAGVQIAVCGQSASSRNIQRHETIEGVQWALSAMTALVYFQNKGYRLIKF